MPLRVEDGCDPNSSQTRRGVAAAARAPPATADDQVGQDEVDPVRPARLPDADAVDVAEGLEQEAGVMADDHRSAKASSQRPERTESGALATAETVALGSVTAVTHHDDSGLT